MGRGGTRVVLQRFWDCPPSRSWGPWDQGATVSLWSLTPRSPQPGQREKSFQPEQESGKVFRGHRCGDWWGAGDGPVSLRGPGVICAALSRTCGPRNQVTCLSVSTDGSVLLSGSHDETVRLWDVQSKQCIRTVTLKGGTGGRPRAWGRGRALGGGGGPCWAGGRSEEQRGPGPPDLPPGPAGPVTNASIMLAPLSMLSSDFRPSLPLPHFNRHLLGAEHGDEQHRGGLTLRLGLHQQVRPAAGAPRGLCGAALRPLRLGPGGGALRRRPPWGSAPLTAWPSPTWWPAADPRRCWNLSECRPLARACARPGACGQRHRVSSLLAGQWAVLGPLVPPGSPCVGGGAHGRGPPRAPALGSWGLLILVSARPPGPAPAPHRWPGPSILPPGPSGAHSCSKPHIRGDGARRFTPLRHVGPGRASGDRFEALIPPSASGRQGGAALARWPPRRQRGLFRCRARSPATWRGRSGCTRCSAAPWRRWAGPGGAAGRGRAARGRSPAEPRPSPPQSVLGGQDQLRIRVTELEDEVQNLRKINRDLFDFSTHMITRPSK